MRPMERSEPGEIVVVGEAPQPISHPPLGHRCRRGGPGPLAVGQAGSPSRNAGQIGGGDPSGTK
jgi:hypothetical protein